jgi:hypothetical protein
MPLYFAYGEDLDLAKFRARSKLPDAIPVAPASLRGYRLVFRQLVAGNSRLFADIASDTDGVVFGALFDLPDAAVTALNAIPLVGVVIAPYKISPCQVVLDLADRGPVLVAAGRTLQHGDEVTAILYEASTKPAPTPPPRETLNAIISGALECGLPIPWVRSLLGSSAPASGVAELSVGKRDLAGNAISRIHSKVPPLYAVYETDRVVVQYADDQTVAGKQRQAMAPLNNLRSQITGLLEGWQTRSGEADFRAKKYNARVAAALVICLEQDPENAKEALLGVRDDIINERASLGRFQYLWGALSAGATFITAFYLIWHGRWFANIYTLPMETADLWLAARGGTVGAFFSIALSLRGRTIKTDLHRWDNVSDAALRVAIGAIAGGVIVLLLQSKLLASLTVGTMTTSGAQLDWRMVVVLGFVAGFIERLVPDLLEKNAKPDDTSGVAGIAGSAAGGAGSGNATH